MVEAAKGDWDADFKEEEEEKKDSNSQSDYRKVNYTNMSNPGKYIIRLAGAHVRLRPGRPPHW